MIILEPDGLFHGKRLARCSDLAQLFFPRLLLASNGYGRLEIDFDRIRNEAFSSLSVKPTNDLLRKTVEEYVGNFLLFLYEAEGETWGQWDVAPNWLPRYKNAVDRRSPAPDAEAFKKWLALAKSQKPQPFPKVRGNSPKLSENFRPVVAVAVAGVVAVAESREVVGPVETVEKDRSKIVEREQQKLLERRKRQGPKKLQPVGELFDSFYQCQCGHRFPSHLGKHGCPNCHGESTANLVRLEAG